MTDNTDHDPLGQYQFDAYGRFVDLDEMELERYPAPPLPRLVPVDDLGTVKGMRVAVNSRRGPQYDLRAVSDVFIDNDGGRWVNIALECRWYAWLNTPECQRPESVPRATCWPTDMVWAEVYDT